jgi:hypothetical protein
LLMLRVLRWRWLACGVFGGVGEAGRDRVSFMALPWYIDFLSNRRGGFNMKKFFVLAACLVLSVPAFAFQAGMRAAQISTEITMRLKSGETSKQIIAAAKAAGINAAVLQASLLGAGFDANLIFATMVAAGFSPDDMLSATASGGGGGNQNGGGGANFGQSRAGNMSGTGGCRSASCS